MKNIYILAILLVVAAAVFIGITYIAEPEKTPEGMTEYQSVTIKELIGFADQYDGKNILVKGKFTDMTNRAVPMCMPTGTGLFPQIKGYKTYPSNWSISNQDGEIGIDVIDENSVHTSTMPNYKEGQEIELRGVAKSTTVADSCSRDIRFKSVYIEVRAKDVDMTLTPSPKTLPEIR